MRREREGRIKIIRRYEKKKLQLGSEKEEEGRTPLGGQELETEVCTCTGALRWPERFTAPRNRGL